VAAAARASSCLRPSMKTSAPAPRKIKRNGAPDITRRSRNNPGARRRPVVSAPLHRFAPLTILWYCSQLPVTVNPAAKGGGDYDQSLGDWRTWFHRLRAV
jgi:hypothetical protein